MDNSFERASKTLELDKVLGELKNLASASITSEYIESIEISTDFDEIKNRLNETNEALKLILSKGEPQLFGIVDIKNIIKRVEIGGSLSASALLQVSDFLRVSRGLKTYLKKRIRQWWKYKVKLHRQINWRFVYWEKIRRWN